MHAGIQIGEIEKSSSQSVRILGIWVDPKPTRKESQPLLGELSFLRARQVYTAVIRPALTYGAAIWQTPAKSQSCTVQGVAAKLGKIRLQGLTELH